MAAIPVAILAGALVVSSFAGPPAHKDPVIFHASLADPDLYEGGTYTSSFEINAGDHEFRFVPNGSSPKTLTITVQAEDLVLTESFALRGELHESWIAKYHTWKYEGNARFTATGAGTAAITIDPNGDTMGSVSVDIVEKSKGATP